MKIKEVVAQPNGAFRVTIDDRAPVAMSMDGETDEHKVLAAWFMAGNKAQSWVPDIEQIRAQKKTAVLAWIDALTAQITDKYSRDEVAAFGSKRADATQHLAGEAASVLLVNEAAQTGETTQELAQAIIDNDAIYTAIIGKMTGLRRVTFKAIDDAKTSEAVLGQVETARNAVAAMAADHGLTLRP